MILACYLAYCMIIKEKSGISMNIIHNNNNKNDKEWNVSRIIQVLKTIGFKETSFKKLKRLI